MSFINKINESYKEFNGGKRTKVERKVLIFKKTNSSISNLKWGYKLLVKDSVLFQKISHTKLMSFNPKGSTFEFKCQTRGYKKPGIISKSEYKNNEYFYVIFYFKNDGTFEIELLGILSKDEYNKQIKHAQKISVLPVDDNQFSKTNEFSFKRTNFVSDDEMKLINKLKEKNIKIKDIDVVDFGNNEIINKGFKEKVRLSIFDLKEIIKDQSLELTVQQFFRKNLYIIGILISLTKNFKYKFEELVKENSQSKIDLLISDDKNSYFIEFKNAKPLPFLSVPYRDGDNQKTIYALGKEVTGAIVQVSEYSDLLIAKYKNDPNFEVYSGQKIIIGWSFEGLDDDKIHSYQHFKINNNVRIITLDEIMNILEWFLLNHD